MVHTYIGEHTIGTELCDPQLHCYSHDRDETGLGIRRCFECGHLYRTLRDLRRAYRREANQFMRYDWPTSSWCRTADPSKFDLLWFWVRSRFTRIRKITWCQECSHDF